MAGEWDVLHGCPISRDIGLMSASPIVCPIDERADVGHTAINPPASSPPRRTELSRRQSFITVTKFGCPFSLILGHSH